MKSTLIALITKYNNELSLINKVKTIDEDGNERIYIKRTSQLLGITTYGRPDDNKTEKFLKKEKVRVSGQIFKITKEFVVVESRIKRLPLALPHYLSSPDEIVDWCLNQLLSHKVLSLHEINHLLYNVDSEGGLLGVRKIKPRQNESPD